MLGFFEVHNKTINLVFGPSKRFLEHLGHQAKSVNEMFNNKAERKHFYGKMKHLQNFKDYLKCHIKEETCKWVVKYSKLILKSSVKTLYTYAVSLKHSLIC